VTVSTRNPALFSAVGKFEEAPGRLATHTDVITTVDVDVKRVLSTTRGSQSHLII
jgi:hypothetical protein